MLFLHNKLLVMDNATIHIHGNSRIIKDILWETMVKLIFYILELRIRLYQYRTAGPCDNAVLHKAAQVMNEMSYALILRCCAHCGY
jgi:hypothetical protein